MKNFINLKAADGHVFSSYLAEPKGVRDTFQDLIDQGHSVMDRVSLNNMVSKIEIKIIINRMTLTVNIIHDLR